MKLVAQLAILYHDTDINVKAAIIRHLAVLQRQQKLRVWEKGLVMAGENQEELQNFNSNIDEVEDLLDALMRQIQFDQHTGPNFTKAVRSASHYLYAAAALLSISAIIFSMHPPQ